MNLTAPKNAYSPDLVYEFEDSTWLKFYTPSNYEYDYDFFCDLPELLRSGDKFFKRMSFNSDDHYVVYKSISSNLIFWS